MTTLNSKIILFLPIFSYLAIFYYYPMGKIFVNAPNLTFIFDYLFHNPLVSRFFWFTLSQSILTVLISLVFGIPSGYILARQKPILIKWFRTIFTVPFIFPPLAILMGFVITFDQNGILYQVSNGRLTFDPFSYSGIVFAHSIFNISVVARITESSLYSEPQEYHELAIVMGANSSERFKSITLPHIRPSLEAAGLLVFLYAFNSFGIVLILGEVRYQTIEVMIYSQSQARLRFDRAIALALLQMIFDIIIIIIYLSRSSYQTKIIEGTTIPRSDEKVKSTIFLSIIALIMWFPVIVLLYQTYVGLVSGPSVIRTQLLSGHYNSFIGASSLRVIENTLFFGIATAGVAWIFGVLIALMPDSNGNDQRFSKITNFLILLPMTTSAITFSLAILIAFGTISNFNELVWLFILSAHILATLPFISRIVISGRSRIPEDLLLVSRSFGSNIIDQFRHVIWPYMKNSLQVAGLFAFAISIGEFGATFYLARGQWITLSLAIDKLFSSRTAILPNLYALILVGFATGVLYLIEKIGALELRI